LYRREARSLVDDAGNDLPKREPTVTGCAERRNNTQEAGHFMHHMHGPIAQPDLRPIDVQNRKIVLVT
jgi:hypothetical protein